MNTFEIGTYSGSLASREGLTYVVRYVVRYVDLERLSAYAGSRVTILLRLSLHMLDQIHSCVPFQGP